MRKKFLGAHVLKRNFIPPECEIGGVMMITGWMKTLMSSLFPRASEVVGQGAQAFEKKAKAKLVDVTEGLFLTEEARKQNALLGKIVSKSGGRLNGILFGLNSRRKVKKNLADFYDTPEIIDEITEKIREVAEHDPFYRKLFS